MLSAFARLAAPPRDLATAQAWGAAGRWAALEMAGQADAPAARRGDSGTSRPNTITAGQSDPAQARRSRIAERATELSDDPHQYAMHALVLRAQSLLQQLGGLGPAKAASVDQRAADGSRMPAAATASAPGATPTVAVPRTLPSDATDRKAELRDAIAQTREALSGHVERLESMRHELDGLLQQLLSLGQADVYAALGKPRVNAREAWSDATVVQTRISQARSVWALQVVRLRALCDALRLGEQSTGASAH